MDVDIDGRIYRVEARRAGPGWLMSVNGRSFDVVAAPVGDRWSLLVAPAGSEPEGRARVFRSYDVALERRGERRALCVNGHAVATALRRRGRLGSGALQSTSTEPAGPSRVAAPMPGRIVKVLVRPGDAVEARQPLVVVEAMKMENELRAPKAGTVTEVRVTEGSLVEARTVLVVVA